MKASSILLRSAALFGCAAANNSYLWIVDTTDIRYPSPKGFETSSDTISSIITRRRGLTDEKYLGAIDWSTANDLSKFGGYQSPLFGAKQEQDPSRLFIRLWDYDGDVSKFESPPNLWAKRPNMELVDTLMVRKPPQGICEYAFTVPSKPGIDVIYTHALTQDSSCHSVETIKDMPAILAVFNAIPTAKNVEKNMGSFLQVLSHLADTENLESTVLVLPAPSTIGGQKQLARRVPGSEEPLDLPSLADAKGSDERLPLVAFKSNHSLPKTIPSCFKSEETCTNVTNSCSGHGKCHKAHGGCFKCQCTQSTYENDDGSKKVINWAGNACEKKDISVPFIMFASLAVLFLTLIGGSIGLLYDMGAQELPSVLGAGVAGPRPQK